MAKSRLRTALTVLLAFLMVPLALTEAFLRLYERYFRTVHLKWGSPTSKDPWLDLPRLGYSNGPIRAAKAPDEERILSLGDSFAYGIVEDRYNYNRVLERHLSQKSGRRFSVVNLGRPDTTFPDYQRELEFWTALLQYDAVILNLYAGNDFIDIGATAFAPPSGGRSEGGRPDRAFAAGVPVPHRFPLRLADYFQVFWQSWELADRAPEPGYRNPTRLPRDRYIQIMSEASQIYREQAPAADWQALVNSCVALEELLAHLEALRGAGKEILVFVSPPHLLLSERLLREVHQNSRFRAASYDLSLPGKIVRATADRAGYRGAVYDIYPCLQQYAQGGAELYYGTDTHWSVEGNRVVGNFLTDLLGHDRLATGSQRRFSECTIPAAVPSPDEAVAEFLAAKLQPLETLQGLMRGVEVQRFSDQASVEAFLERLGFRSADSLRGYFERVQAGDPDHIWGWAADAEKKRAALLLLAFYNGTVVATGTPGGKRPDVNLALGFQPSDPVLSAFRLIAPGLCSTLVPADRLWLLAVSDRRTYAWLGYAAQVACP